MGIDRLAEEIVEKLEYVCGYESIGLYMLPLLSFRLK